MLQGNGNHHMPYLEITPTVRMNEAVVAKESSAQGHEHHRHIHLAGDMSYTQIESFSEATVPYREKMVQGLKKEDSASLPDSASITIVSGRVWGWVVMLPKQRRERGLQG